MRFPALRHPSIIFGLWCRWLPLILSSLARKIQCQIYHSVTNRTMDPVSALGLAAAIVQFVTFASKILSSATEIRHSTTGVSTEAQSIENVYLTLRDINGNLSVAARQAARSLEASIPTSTTINELLMTSTVDSALSSSSIFDAEVDPLFMLKTSYTSLNSLLASCEVDCGKIMRIVSKLKAASASGSKWDCFRAALKTVWRRDDIAQVEERLEKAQRGVMMEMSNISKYDNCLHLLGSMTD